MQRTLDLNSETPTVQQPEKTFDDIKKNFTLTKRKCQEKQPPKDSSSIEVVFFKNEAPNDNESHNDVEIEIDKANQKKVKGSTKKPNQKFKNQCDDCGKAFGDRYKLKRHVEGVHQKIKNFECTICSSKFYRKFHLERHNKSHILKSELPELPDNPFREEMDE